MTNGKQKRETIEIFYVLQKVIIKGLKGVEIVLAKTRCLPSLFLGVRKNRNNCPILIFLIAIYFSWAYLTCGYPLSIFLLAKIHDLWQNTPAAVPYRFKKNVLSSDLPSTFISESF